MAFLPATLRKPGRPLPLPRGEGCPAPCPGALPPAPPCSVSTHQHHGGPVPAPPEVLLLLAGLLAALYALFPRAVLPPRLSATCPRALAGSSHVPPTASLLGPHDLPLLARPMGHCWSSRPLSRLPGSFSFLLKCLPFRRPGRWKPGLLVSSASCPCRVLASPDLPLSTCLPMLARWGLGTWASSLSRVPEL